MLLPPAARRSANSVANLRVSMCTAALLASYAYVGTGCGIKPARVRHTNPQASTTPRATPPRTPRLRMHRSSLFHARTRAHNPSLAARSCRAHIYQHSVAVCAPAMEPMLITRAGSSDVDACGGATRVRAARQLPSGSPHLVQHGQAGPSEREWRLQIHSEHPVPRCIRVKTTRYTACDACVRAAPRAAGPLTNVRIRRERLAPRSPAVVYENVERRFTRGDISRERLATCFRRQVLRVPLSK